MMESNVIGAETSITVVGSIEDKTLSKTFTVPKITKNNIQSINIAICIFKNFKTSKYKFIYKEVYPESYKKNIIFLC